MLRGVTKKPRPPCLRSPERHQLAALGRRHEVLPGVHDRVVPVPGAADVLPPRPAVHQLGLGWYPHLRWHVCADGCANALQPGAESAFSQGIQEGQKILRILLYGSLYEEATKKVWKRLKGFKCA